MTKWTKKLTVRKRYDLTAQMYDNRYAQEQEAKYALAFETVSVPKKSRVADVGCGTGLLFAQLAPKTGEIVGFDISKNLLLGAKEKARVFGNVFVVQADADYLPVKDALFDVVFSFTVLQNMPNPAKTMKEMGRITKAEGSIAVTGLKKAFDPELFKKLLKKSGWSVLSFSDDASLKCYVAVCSRKSA